MATKLYTELRRIAVRAMHNESAGHTLQATALVHEAYLRLVDSHQMPTEDGEFKLLVAMTMRRALIDHAKSKGAAKRGGDRRRVLLEESLRIQEHHPLDVLELDELLERLSERDARQAQVVELRVFGGFKRQEVADALD